MLKSRWQLRTAAGEVDAIISVGATLFNHWVLIVDIEKDVILGMDVMSEHSFRLDLKKRRLRVGSGELILHQKKEVYAQMVLTKEERSELLVTPQVEGSFEEGTIAMLEISNEDSGGQ